MGPGRVGDQKEVQDQHAGNGQDLPGHNHLDQDIHKLLGHIFIFG
jgi:hypothetical protein